MPENKSENDTVGNINKKNGVLSLLVALPIWFLFAFLVYLFTKAPYITLSPSTPDSETKVLSVEEKEKLLISMPFSGKSLTIEEKKKLLDSIPLSGKTISLEEKIRLLESQ